MSAGSASINARYRRADKSRPPASEIRKPVARLTGVRAARGVAGRDPLSCRAVEGEAGRGLQRVLGRIDMRVPLIVLLFEVNRRIRHGHVLLADAEESPDANDDSVDRAVMIDQH